MKPTTLILGLAGLAAALPVNPPTKATKATKASKASKASKATEEAEPTKIPPKIGRLPDGTYITKDEAHAMVKEALAKVDIDKVLGLDKLKNKPKGSVVIVPAEPIPKNPGAVPAELPKAVNNVPADAPAPAPAVKAADPPAKGSKIYTQEEVTELINQALANVANLGKQSQPGAPKPAGIPAENFVAKKAAGEPPVDSEDKDSIKQFYAEKAAAAKPPVTSQVKPEDVVKHLYEQKLKEAAEAAKNPPADSEEKPAEKKEYKNTSPVWQYRPSDGPYPESKPVCPECGPVGPRLKLNTKPGEHYRVVHESPTVAEIDRMYYGPEAQENARKLAEGIRMTKEYYANKKNAYGNSLTHA